MTRRETIHTVLRGERPPYVPWSFQFTAEARETLESHFAGDDLPLERRVGNHIGWVGGVGGEEDLGDGRFRDVYGVVWNRSIDKDIGVVDEPMLPEADVRAIDSLPFPDPGDPRFFDPIDEHIAQDPDDFRLFGIGFSLYERAWSFRGMESVMMDFIEAPEFLHALLDRIVEFNIAVVRKAVTYDIDAVYFGDDWGQQQGLQMGYDLWKEFIHPRLVRQYAAVRESGKYVVIHSCGDVDELFDDLVDIGVNLFNPFQPEVMDVASILAERRARPSFWGGLSTQQTLPSGSVDAVREESRHLLELGREGGYVFGPAHAVEGDVSLANMLAFIEEAQAQSGAPKTL